MSESAFGVDHGHFSKAIPSGVFKPAKLGQQKIPTPAAAGGKRAAHPSSSLGSKVAGGSHKGAGVGSKASAGAKNMYGNVKNYATANPGKTALIGGGGLGLTGGVYAAGKSSGREKNGRIR